MASEAGDYQPATYQLPRRREHTIALPFLSAPQAAILGVALVSGIIVMVSGMGLPGLLVMMTLGAAIAYTKIKGSHLYYWVPVSLAYLRRQANGSSAPVAEINSRLWPRRGDDVAKPTPFEQMVPGIEIIRVDYGGGVLAVLHNKTDDTFGVALTARANHFTLMDPPEQDGVLFDYGALLDKLAAEGSIVTDLAWFATTQPSTTIAHERWYAGRVSKPHAKARQSYSELIGEAAAAPEHEITLLVQTTRDRAGRTASLRKSKRRAAKEAIYAKLIQSLEQVAHALVGLGLRDIQPLSPSMVIHMIRHGQDPNALVQTSIDEDQMVSRALDELAHGQPPSQPTVSSSQFMSAFALKEGPDTVRADSTLHQILLVEEYPSHNIGSAHFQPLLNATIPCRVVWRGASEPMSSTIRRLEHQGSMSDLQEDYAATHGIRIRRSRRTQSQKREAQLDAIETGASTWRYVTLIDVYGVDETDLAQNVAAVLEAAGKCGLVLRVAYFRQAEALTHWCLPVPQQLR